MFASVRVLLKCFDVAGVRAFTRRSLDSRRLGGEIRRVRVGLGLGFVEMANILVYSSVSIQFDHRMIIGIKI
jgi:hypothetical protein